MKATPYEILAQHVFSIIMVIIALAIVHFTRNNYYPIYMLLAMILSELIQTRMQGEK